MEELRQYFQIVKFVILIFAFITIFIIGVWLEKNRPVELIPYGNGFFKKIKKGPPWLAISALIEFVVITMIFIL